MALTAPAGHSTGAGEQQAMSALEPYLPAALPMEALWCIGTPGSDNLAVEKLLQREYCAVLT